MKAEKTILIAFILNFTFSVLEFVGSALTGSVAIFSDAVHDLGDAASIGIAFFLEKKSRKQPDKSHTYGYAGYSVIGSVITMLILVLGSALVIYHALGKIIHPAEINYNGMILLAIIGVVVNTIASFVTREGDSLNQKAVNLHMLEDVLGWIVVLIGSIIMRFTDVAIIDPLMSIGVAVFILINAARGLKGAIDLFLEKTPKDINIDTLCEHILEIEGVLSVHHIHIWSIDGQSKYATMHVVATGAPHGVKERVRAKLREHGIGHVTLECESEGEHCDEKDCHTEPRAHWGHSHHYH